MTLFLGLVLLFSLIILANIAEVRRDHTLRRAVSWLFILFNLPIFFLGLTLLIVSPQELAATDFGLGLTRFRPAGVALLGMAIWGLLATLPEFRHFVARWVPLNPNSPVHTLALILAGYLIGNSVITLSQGGLEGLVETTTPASIYEVVLSELLYVAAALAGVGFFVRRSFWKTLDRLGLEKPTPAQLLLSFRWVGLLIVLQWLFAGLFLLLDPEQAEVLENLNTLLLGNIDTIWEWFVLALAAAVGEEILFRGALQPVFGLWLTSFIFAFAHIQYGFTPATALVFVIGLVLGHVRNRTNTSVAIFVHFSYNFILGLLSLLAPYLESLVQ